MISVLKIWGRAPHFILGDFFVVDKSTVKFDESMSLKEDYDFTCSHIKAHGSVMRCQRMTLSVKHYSNGGGAVDVRDKKGLKEQYNIAILNKKWPGCFRANPKRRNEVIMRWRGAGDQDGDDDDEDGEGAAVGKASIAKKSSARVKQALKRTIRTKAKSLLPRGLPANIQMSARTKCIAQPDSAADYILKRCKKADGKTVGQCLGMLYQDTHGASKKYGISDLKYDLAAGRFRLQRS